MYEYKITAAEKINVQEDSTQLLSVQFEIIKNIAATDEAEASQEVVATLRHGFPLDTPPETIREELAKVADTFASDAHLAEARAEVEEANKQADQTIAALTAQDDDDE